MPDGWDFAQNRIFGLAGVLIEMPEEGFSFETCLTIGYRRANRKVSDPVG